MVSCGRTWQPTEIQWVIEPIQSSTCVVRVATDAGNGFLKGMGNPAGNEALAMDLVGCELASALGLYVPPFAIVDVEGITITTIKGTELEYGPGFISKDIKGSPADPSDTFFDKLSNPDDVAKLVALDTWIRNFDRCPPSDYFDPTPKWDNLFFAPDGNKFQLVVIDHTHAFVEDDLATGLTGDHFETDPRVFGAFPQFMPYINEGRLREAASLIRAIDAAAIEEIVAAVPLRWGPTSGTRKRWIEAIVERGKRVEQYLVDGLIAQQVLDV